MLGHIDDKRTIYFECINRQLAEVAERGVAGTEVVYGDLKTHLAQGLELGNNEVVGRDEISFRICVAQ